jgi:hypothetical protein
MTIATSKGVNTREKWTKGLNGLFEGLVQTTKEERRG